MDEQACRRSRREHRSVGGLGVLSWRPLGCFTCHEPEGGIASSQGGGRWGRAMRLDSDPSRKQFVGRFARRDEGQVSGQIYKCIARYARQSGRPAHFLVSR